MTTEQPLLLSLEEAADLLGISTDELLRSRGRGLSPGKLGFKDPSGNVLLWKREDLEANRHPWRGRVMAGGPTELPRKQQCDICGFTPRRRGAWRVTDAHTTRKDDMAFLEDIVADTINDISHIGLGTSATTEVTGGGYAHKVPTYGTPAAGAADITTTLEFDGPVGTNVTHVFFKKGGSLWIARPVDAAKVFNADGRLDLTSAEVTAALG